MKEKFWKTVYVIVLIMLSTLGFHVIIRAYKEGQYWPCSFYAVAEYLLLNLTKDIINLKIDEDKQKDKGSEE